MKILSLFSGCGGLDLGFHRAGFEPIWACDTDRVASDSYALNFPCVTDKISIADVKRFPEGAEGVIGGPPCQSYSIGGAGRGMSDPRGDLFNHYIRAIAQLRPKFFLAENVPGLLLPRHADSWQAILSTLEGLGYKVKSQVLNASDYGVPQERRRLFILGFRGDLGVEPSFPEAGEESVTVIKEALYNLPEHPVLSRRCESAYSPRYMSRNRSRGWYELSYTIVASASQVPQHPNSPMKKVEGGFAFVSKRPMRLSPVECARLQTFPDQYDWGAVDTIEQAYRLIGNAVPPALAFSIARHIKEVLK